MKLFETIINSLTFSKLILKKLLYHNDAKTIRITENTIKLCLVNSDKVLFWCWTEIDPNIESSSGLTAFI